MCQQRIYKEANFAGKKNFQYSIPKFSTRYENFLKKIGRFLMSSYTKITGKTDA